MKAERPVIGRQYRRQRFEQRDRDGAYSAFNVPPRGHEELIQRALLNDAPPLQWSVPAAIALAIIVGAYIASWGWA